MKRLDQTQLQKELFLRTEGYAANIREIFRTSIQNIINLVKDTELEDGVPFSFDEYGYGDDANRILRNLYASVYKEIRMYAQHEWILADLNNDSLVKSVFGEKSVSDNHFNRFFGRNKQAMDSFLNRKSGIDGFNLSKRVWNLTRQHKTELEDSIDLALGEGTPANSLATKIKQYLNEPDRFYRRFRIKIKEDGNGNPVYGYVWKRRTFDKASGIYKWINDDPKKYHPGRGVYRSSYRNAQRLARNETNIAYRSSDYDRIQDFDFVVATEIKLSNNHPVVDICNDLQGIYPKTIKWTGWHSNCRCYRVSILASDKEIDQMIENIMDGKDTKGVANRVTELPDNFKEWLDNNRDKILQSKDNGTLPYFIKDNLKHIRL